MYPKHQLVELLRKNLDDPNGSRSMMSQQDTFSGHTDETEFTLAENPISHIDSVTVNAVAQQKWLDYEVDTGEYRTDGVGMITLKTATSNDVVVNYKTALSGSQWIFPDFPHEKITATNAFPRISVVDVSESVTRGHIGSGAIKGEDIVSLQISIWTKFAKQQILTVGDHSYSGESLADYLAMSVRAEILQHVNTELNPELIFTGDMMIHKAFPDQSRMLVWHKPIDIQFFRRTT